MASRKEYLRNWRANNPDKVKASREKEAGKSKARMSKWRALNPDKARNRRKLEQSTKSIWTEANKERAKTQRKIWNADNSQKVKLYGAKRRAKKSDITATLTEEEWNLILQDFDFLCAYCDAPWEEQDHFIPLSKGGTHTADNVFPSCIPCNRGVGGKHNKLPLDWINESS